MTRRATILLASLILFTIAGNVYFLAQQAETPPLPALCAYPEPAGIKALHDEVDRRVTAIRRHSPGQPIDQLTLEMDAFSDCYPGRTR